MTGAVRGNGITLGLTNGTNNFGFQKWNSTGNFEPTVNAYNTNTGNTVSTAGTPTVSNYTTVGITTDSSKSGIIVERNSSKYLNFYIN